MVVYLLLFPISRFPFPFPCRDISSRTVIVIFSMFGLLSFVHSDKGAAYRGRQAISSKARSCVEPYKNLQPASELSVRTVQRSYMENCELALESLEFSASLRQTDLKFFPMR